MIVNLYTNGSDNNVIDKQLTDRGTVTGVVRGSINIQEPSITLETTSPLVGVNYCYIAEYGRYYYATPSEKDRNGLTTITCRVDVLKTYADEIRQQKAIVSRQANQYNLYLDDGTFKVYNNPHIITRKFPSGFSGMSFILSVAGDQ